MRGEAGAQTGGPALPPGSRLAIRETPDGLGIYRPVTRNLVMIAFLLAWLCGWAAGEYFAVSEIMRGGHWASGTFLLVWLVIWTVAGAGVAGVVLWNLFGAERLFITGGALVHTKGVGPYGVRTVHLVDEVRNLRIRQVRGMNRAPASVISYEAGGRTHDLWGSLDVEERTAVHAALLRHLPDRAAEGADP